jgi:PHD/YefM family antitoxin component YafN of YafNO toxin-antitoxin module
MSAVPKIQPIPPVDQLHRTPASDVKKLGWRGVMRQLQTQGPVLVTNHQQPEAVILPVQAYAALLERAQHAVDPAEATLEALRRRFDERLAVLNTPEAGDRLRGLMDGPARLGGEVQAGASY